MLKSKLGLVTAGVLAATLSMQSMAQEVATAQAPLSVDELSFAFADVGSADVLAMSQGEMLETEGAWIPNAIGGAGGAFGGHWGYMMQSSFAREYNFRNHMVAIGVGGAMGAANPVRGIGSAAWAIGGGTGAGALSGWASRTGTTHRW